MRTIAPSAIGEAVYQAAQAARHPDVRGIPDPRAAWRPTLDPERLSGFIAAAFRAHLDAIAPAATRAAIAAALLAELDRRFPPDTMVALARYGLARRYIEIAVDLNGDGRTLGRFDLPDWRNLPDFRSDSGRPATIRYTLTPAPGEKLHLIAPPDGVRGALEMIAAAHAIRRTEFASAWGVPRALKQQLGRQPRWGEIEAAAPRVGAWLARMRSA